MDFTESVARAFFVTNWADRMEEMGESFSGEDIMEVAPDTSPYALHEAARFVARL